MAQYWEVWTRPGDPAFGRVIDDPPFREGAIHDGVNLLGDGRLQMPSSFDRFDDILSTVNSSLVRVWDDTTNEIIYEWLPSSVNPTASKNDPYVDVAGEGIKEVLTYAITGPYRSALPGSDIILAGEIPSQPDWSWGGANIIANPGFEENSITPKVFQLQIIASAGTFTLTDGTDTTSAIAFNASAATIETEIEADLGLLPDVIVVQTATAPTTFIVQMVDPPFGVVLGINAGGLTGTGTTNTVQEGGELPSPWTKAMTVATGLPPDQGAYDQWQVSDNENHTPDGSLSLAVEPSPPGISSNRNLGAQQIVSVKPDSIYQASVWVFPTSGSDRFRLGLFTFGEELIAWTSSAGQTFTPNVWNELVLSDILIPAGITQAIFRIVNTNLFPSTPSIAYWDDAEMIEGEPPGSPGTIIGDLYAAYVDPVKQFGTIYWDDGSGTDTPYLTLDFDGTNNSSGVPWANPEVEMRVYMRQNFYQVLTQLATMEGLEFRVVPDDPELGTWLLQVYDEGQMSTDYTAAAGPAIQGGANDVDRQVRRFRPSSSFTVEGVGRLVATVQDATLMADFGKIAAQRLDREAVDATGVLAAASGDANDALITGQIYAYELVAPQETPGVAYILGDILTIHDPPEADGPGRFWDWTATFTPEMVTHKVQFFAEDESSPVSP